MATIDKPVVSFAGPLISACEAMKLAEDFLERRRFIEGIHQLKLARDAAVRAIAFIETRYAEEILEEAKRR